jgi:plastocyanin
MRTNRIFASAVVLVCATSAAAAENGSVAGKVTATPDKYLKDTVVYLKEVPGGYAPKTHAMDQKGMEFRPHILTVTAGDAVKFLNSDGVDHNVYSPDDDAYNLGIFPKGQSRDHTFTKPGVYTQLCSVHPEMLAYIFVGQNPYAVPVNKDGTFKIDNVPPGAYQLAVWNPKLKADDTPVTVAAGKSAQADFALAR